MSRLVVYVIYSVIIFVLAIILGAPSWAAFGIAVIACNTISSLTF